jgi:hypothetical protein
MKAEKGCDTRTRKKVIPVFFHFHIILPVIYLMEWMQRKDVKWAREKINHKDDVSWLLPMPLRSTCYLFYGMEAQKGREARKRKKVIIRMMIPIFCHFHTVLPVIYFMELRPKKNYEDYAFWLLSLHLPVIYWMDGDRGSTWSEQERK